MIGRASRERYCRAVQRGDRADGANDPRRSRAGAKLRAGRGCLDARYEKAEPFSVAFANAHALNVAAASAGFRAALQNALVFNDGIGVDIASRLLYGSPFPENLNGRISVPTICGNQASLQDLPAWREARHGRTGGKASFLICPRHTVRGFPPRPFRSADEIPELIDLIRRSKANVLLVAMGNPKQELFIQNHLAATGCMLGMGVGALFDFLAGNVPRATPWVQRWRLEWVYRLPGATAPGRSLPCRHPNVLDACRDAALVGRAD